MRTISRSLPELCHTMDQAVSALLQDLETIGKLNDTIVVLTTEFGRTPLINQNVGRDHYPQAFTSVLAGVFKSGYVHGKTSEGAEEVVEGSMTIPDFNATIAYALGIPVDQVMYSPTVRPFTVAHKGKPQLQLFALILETDPDFSFKKSIFYSGETYGVCFPSAGNCFAYFPMIENCQSRTEDKVRAMMDALEKNKLRMNELAAGNPAFQASRCS